MGESKETEEERRATVHLFYGIGQFIFEFSQLEWVIRHTLDAALKLDGGFETFDAVISSYDFATLCRVTKTILCKLSSTREHNSKELIDIFNKCSSANDIRVRVVHGTWFVDGSSISARHVSCQTLEPKDYFGGSEELVIEAKKLYELRTRVLKFLIAMMPSEATNDD